MSLWRNLDHGVFVRRYESLSLAIGAIIGDDGVLLVDTRASHRQAEALRDDLTQLTPKPVRWVVNTHYHWDHCWGNALFRESELWGHENTRGRLMDEGEAVRTTLMSNLPDEYRDEISEVEIVPPEHTFSDRMSLDIGRAVTLRHHGRGHTDSDISIGVGAVLFAGDLVEEAAPPSFGDSFPLDWPNALAGLLEHVGGPVVPGHGSPVDRAFVQQQRAEIAATVQLAREGYETGTPVDQVDLRHAPFPVEVSRSVVERTYAQLTGAI